MARRTGNGTGRNRKILTKTKDLRAGQSKKSENWPGQET